MDYIRKREDVRNYRIKVGIDVDPATLPYVLPRMARVSVGDPSSDAVCTVQFCCQAGGKGQEADAGDAGARYQTGAFSLPMCWYAVVFMCLMCVFPGFQKAYEESVKRGELDQFMGKKYAKINGKKYVCFLFPVVPLWLTPVFVTLCVQDAHLPGLLAARTPRRQPHLCAIQGALPFFTPSWLH